MDDCVFDANALEAEILGRARRLIEFQEVPMERVPDGDKLIDLLITDRLGGDGKPPQQLGAGASRNGPRPVI